MAISAEGQVLVRTLHVSLDPTQPGSGPRRPRRWALGQVLRLGVIAHFPGDLASPSRREDRPDLGHRRCDLVPGEA
ncbi:hypothetical protein WME91_47330 [Sorangium sp. So ce269]